MSLLFLAGDFPPARGGIQTVAYELPLALHRAGQTVGVVALCQSGADEFDAECPYPVVRVPGGKKMQIAQNLAQGARDLAREIGPPDPLIATKWFPDGLAARWAFAFPRPKVVVICHGREAVIAGGNPAKWLAQKMVLARANRIVAVSRWTAEQVARAGVPKSTIRVVPNGIRPEAFAGPGDVDGLHERLGLGTRPVLLTTGRLVARKGHADVVRLLPRVMQELGPVDYLIVGDGPERGSLEAEVRTLGLEGNVHFAGNVSFEDLPTCYHLCDAFVMPVKTIAGDPQEGFGIVYLEANAAGKPVIATDCGGVADPVADGVSGLLLAEGDDDALVAAMVRLLGDPAYARTLGASGQARVRAEFTWEQVAQRFLEAIA